MHIIIPVLNICANIDDVIKYSTMHGAMFCARMWNGIRDKSIPGHGRILRRLYCPSIHMFSHVRMQKGTTTKKQCRNGNSIVIRCATEVAVYKACQIEIGDAPCTHVNISSNDDSSDYQIYVESILYCIPSTYRFFCFVFPTSLFFRRSLICLICKQAE